MVDPCRCTSKLGYEEQLKEIERIWETRKTIKQSTNKILILSHISEAVLGFNKIGLSIAKGVNLLCICALREYHYYFELHISAGLLCDLEEVNCCIANTQAFILKGTIHKTNCENNYLPTLKQSAYFSVFLRGYDNTDLKRITKAKLLPVILFDERPKFYAHVPVMNTLDLLNLYLPVPLPYNLTCNDPSRHLYLTLEQYAV